MVVKSCTKRVHLKYVNFDQGLCKKRGGASCIVVCFMLPQFLDSKKHLASRQWKGMCNLVRHLNSNDYFFFWWVGYPSWLSIDQ